MQSTPFVVGPAVHRGVPVPVIECRIVQQAAPAFGEHRLRGDATDENGAPLKPEVRVRSVELALDHTAATHSPRRHRLALHQPHESDSIEIRHPGVDGAARFGDRRMAEVEIATHVHHEAGGFLDLDVRIVDARVAEDHQFALAAHPQGRPCRQFEVALDHEIRSSCEFDGPRSLDREGVHSRVLLVAIRVEGLVPGMIEIGRWGGSWDRHHVGNAGDGKRSGLDAP